MRELWKPVPGLPGIEASNLGRIRSYWTPGRYSKIEPEGKPRILQPHYVNNRPVLRFKRRRAGEGPEGNRQAYRVAVLVLLAWKGPHEDKGYKFPWYKDSNPANNRVTNLEWSDTQQQFKGRRLTANSRPKRQK